ncbi:hypothetical protein [Nitrosomonas sp. ANs5]
MNDEHGPGNNPLPVFYGARAAPYRLSNGWLGAPVAARRERDDHFV